MFLSEKRQNEICIINKKAEEPPHYCLISTNGIYGLCKYEEMIKDFYKISINRNPKTGFESSIFILNLSDISDKVKKQLVNVSYIKFSKSIVVEVVSPLFENIIKRENFNKHIRHLLKVRYN
jgi:hypothetical protein